MLRKNKDDSIKKFKVENLEIEYMMGACRIVRRRFDEKRKWIPH